MEKQSTFQLILGSTKMQPVFLLMIIALASFLSVFIHTLIEQVQELAAGNPEYDWPKFSDLGIALTACNLLLIAWKLFKKAAFWPCYWMLNPKYSEEEKKIRARRALESVFKGIYYASVTVLGYQLCKDAIWLPPFLGGNGEAKYMLKGWPYISQSSIPYMKYYIMTQLGFHTHTLVRHLTEPPRQSFFEFLLHHTLTMTLIALAYYFNYNGASVLILLSHDFSDVLVCVTKSLMDTTYMRLMLVVYCALVISWAVTRLYFLPIYIIIPAWHNDIGLAEGQEVVGFPLFMAMLLFLQTLHIFWFSNIVQMGYNFVVKKQLGDTIDGFKSKGVEDEKPKSS